MDRERAVDTIYSPQQPTMCIPLRKGGLFAYFVDYVCVFCCYICNQIYNYELININANYFVFFQYLLYIINIVSIYVITSYYSAMEAVACGGS